MHVKYVESNIKGGVNCELSPKTCIVGPNGSGKSTVIQSVELALTGGASDMAGRLVVKRGIDQLVLVPPKVPLFARVGLDNGEECIYEVSPNGKGGAKTPVHRFNSSLFDPEEVLPLRPLRAALIGSADTTRQFFLSRTGSRITMQDIRDRLQPSFWPIFESLAKDMPGKSPAQVLLAVQEQAEIRARSETTAAKQGKVVAAGVGQGLPPPPTEGQMEAAKQAIKNWRQELSRATQAKGAAEAGARAADEIAALQQQIASLRPLREDMERVLVHHRQALAEVRNRIQNQPPIEELSEPKRAARVLVKYLVDGTAHQEEAGVIHCPLCQNEVEVGTVRELLGLMEHVDAQRAQAQAQARAEREQLQQYERAQLGAVQEAEKRLQVVQTELVQKNKMLAQLTSLAHTPPDQPSSGLTLLQIEAKLDAAETYFRDLTSAKSAWEAAQRAMQVSAEAEEGAENWTEFARQCQAAVSVLLEAEQKRFVQAVQQYLPPTDAFALKMHDGSREVCQVGFVRNDVIHTALSGAEWARMVAALAAVCAPKQGLWLVIPEERAFDPDTLTQVLYALGRVEGQVILASPVPPSVSAPGWSFVNTAQYHHRPRRSLPPTPPASPAPGGKEGAAETAGAPEGVGGTEAVTANEAQKETARAPVRTAGWTWPSWSDKGPTPEDIAHPAEKC